MSVIRNKELMNGAVAAAGTTYSTVDLSSDKVSVDVYISMNVSDWVDGSFILTLQHSWDGVNFYDIDSTSALAANGQVIKKQTITNTMPILRLKLVSTVVTTVVDATVSAHIIY